MEGEIRVAMTAIPLEGLAGTVADATATQTLVRDATHNAAWMRLAVEAMWCALDEVGELPSTPATRRREATAKERGETRDPLVREACASGDLVAALEAAARAALGLPAPAEGAEEEDPVDALVLAILERLAHAARAAAAGGARGGRVRAARKTQVRVIECVTPEEARAARVRAPVAEVAARSERAWAASDPAAPTDADLAEVDTWIAACEAAED